MHGSRGCGRAPLPYSNPSQFAPKGEVCFTHPWRGVIPSMSVVITVSSSRPGHKDPIGVGPDLQSQHRLEGIAHERSPLRLAGGVRHHRRHARRRPVRPPQGPCDRGARSRDLVRDLGAHRHLLRRRDLGDGRGRVRAAVLRGLPDREVARGRQRLRLGDHLRRLRGAAPVPAPGAVPRRSGCARAARHLHRRGRRVDRELLLDSLRLRRVPDLHGLPHDPHPQRARAPREIPSAAPLPPLHPDDRDVPRPALTRAQERHPARHTAAGSSRARRGDGCRVRRGLHPGHLRGHQ